MKRRYFPFRNQTNLPLPALLIDPIDYQCRFVHGSGIKLDKTFEVIIITWWQIDAVHQKDQEGVL